MQVELLSDTSQYRHTCQITVEIVKKQQQPYFSLFEVVMAKVWPGDAINLLPYWETTLISREKSHP